MRHTNKKYIQKTLFATLLAILYCVNSAFAESNYSYRDSLEAYADKPRFGLFGGGGFNFHFGNFNSLPGVPSCCPEYRFGSAPGFSVGGLFEMPLKNEWGIAGRIGWHELSGEFEETQPDVGMIDGSPSPIEYTHYMTARFGALLIEPVATYSPVERLNIYGGFFAGIPLAAEYSQYEELTSPSDRGTFIEGNRIRNRNEGDIESKNSLLAGIVLGAGYEFPLNENNSLRAAPEIFYRMDFLSPVTDLSWMIHSVNAGVSIKYKQPPPPPPPPADPDMPLAPILPLPERPEPLTVSLRATQIDSSGVESESIDVRIEDFVSFNLRPLLNYIFFPENSYEIPDRYIKLKKSGTNIFSKNDLARFNAIETYYHVLNIYGKRLRDNPETKITLVGTNCDAGKEENNRELSKRRAETVMKYFTDVWSIDESRISIEARNLPRKASRDSDEPEYAYQENRRVEILTSDAVLEEPVITNDTKRSVSVKEVRFYPEAKSPADIKSWNITAKQKDRIVFEKSGTGELPESIDWSLNGNGREGLTTSGEVGYVLQVTDGLGRTETTQIEILPVEQITINKKRKQKIEDKEFEYYSLILFDYGKSSLRGEHRKIVDYVKARMKEGSTVYVKGYTDAMGDEQTNKRLAQRRANSVGRRLKVPNDHIIGVGETPHLFDNSLPEGRFYCRTVQIEIETKVK